MRKLSDIGGRIINRSIVVLKFSLWQRGSMADGKRLVDPLVASYPAVM